MLRARSRRLFPEPNASGRGEVGQEGFRSRILRSKDVGAFGAHFRGHRGSAEQSKENWTILLHYRNDLSDREVLDILPSCLRPSEVKSSCTTRYLGSLSAQKPFYFIQSSFSQLQIRHTALGSTNISPLWDTVRVHVHEFDDICCG
jgi:hypothetical protein